jgi:subtilase family serine protease
MNMIVAVKQQNLAELEKKFWAVSDPKSPQWQSFLSAEQIGEIVKSKDSDMKTVMDWIKSSVSSKALVHQTADAIEIRGHVADAEALFNAEVFTFVHDNGHTIQRVMGQHSVPADVHAAIDFVEGVADFPMHRASSRKVRKPVGDKPLEQPTVAAMVCPQTLLELYSVPPDSKITKVSQGPA